MDALLNRQPATAWGRFVSSPLLFLARTLYNNTNPPPPTNADPDGRIRIVCISDTHNTLTTQPLLPPGDILIHTGDLTDSGTKEELDAALSFLAAQPHPHKLFIAGNHETCLANDPNIEEYISSTYPTLTYLLDSSAQVTVQQSGGRPRTLRVHGSPYTAKHGSWVFQYPRVHAQRYTEEPTSEYVESESTRTWARVPLLTDILVTHGPPLGHLDYNPLGEIHTSSVGCYALLTALWHVRPKVHIFGHIHVGRGVERGVRWDAAQKAYEDICAKRAGWGALARLAWCRVLGWFWRTSWLGGEDTTIMVNAAAVGGFRDNERKGAIVIEI